MTKRKIENTVQLKADISGTGTPILLLHGFPDSRKMWQTITPYFIKNNYQVIAPDMRGFGDSPLEQPKKLFALVHDWFYKNSTKTHTSLNQ